MKEKGKAIPLKDRNMGEILDELYFDKKGWVVLEGQCIAGVIEGDEELPLEYSALEFYDGRATFVPQGNFWKTEGKHLKYIAHDFEAMDEQDYRKRRKEGEVGKIRTTMQGMIYSLKNGGTVNPREIVLVSITP